MQQGHRMGCDEDDKDPRGQNLPAGPKQLFGQPMKRRFKMVGPLPVKGLAVRIRSLTEGEWSSYTSKLAMARGTPGYFKTLKHSEANFIALCVVDEDGNPFITPEQREEMVDGDNAWDAADTAFLYEVCATHAGIRVQDIRDLAKNSEPIDAGDSPTSSQNA